MTVSYSPVRPAKDQPLLRRRKRRKRVDALTLEQLQRDFWKNFDLEKFANDWRRGIGKRSAA